VPVSRPSARESDHTVIDLVVFLVVVVVLLSVFGRRRLLGVGRGFRAGVREFRRGKAGLPPADPALRDDRDV